MRRDRGQLLLRLVIALGGGGLLCLAFPTFDVWVAAPLALALLAWAGTGLGARRGMLAGTLFGLAFFVPTLSWSGIYVGALPWLALSTLEALFVGLAGALYGWLSRTGRVRPLAFALVWVVTEGFRARAPYGGFPWVKLAFSQADSPVGRLVALGGAPFVGFVLALVGALLALTVQRALAARHDRSRMPWRPLALPVAGALVLARRRAGGSAAHRRPGRRSSSGCRATCPQAGLDFNAQRRAVLDNHVAATWEAQAEIETGRAPTPDLVVWPENASDIDPVRNADARDEIAATVTKLGRPLVVGGLLEEPPGQVSNVSLLYEPGKGITDRYVKRHPVPFGEYIPNRAFFRTISAEVDRVSRDFVAGPSVGVFDVTGTAGQQIRAGRGDLLRGRLRRPHARHRRRRGQRAARADQQRDLRLHRRVTAAAGDQPGAGDGVRPVGRPRVDRRPERPDHPGRNCPPGDVVVHTGPRSRGSTIAGRHDRGDPTGGGPRVGRRRRARASPPRTDDGAERAAPADDDTEDSTEDKEAHDRDAA